MRLITSIQMNISLHYDKIIISFFVNRKTYAFMSFMINKMFCWEIWTNTGCFSGRNTNDNLFVLRLKQITF